MIAVRVALVLAVAVSAIYLGVLMAMDAGHVLVAYGEWAVSTTLWGALAAILVMAFAVYGVARVVRTLAFRNSKLARWFSAKRSQTAQAQTCRALEEEANGNTVEAIRLLIAAGSHSPYPLLHFMRASELAERIGAHAKAEELRQDAMRLCHNDTPALQLFAAASRLYAEQKREGVIAFKRLLEVHPQCAPALLRLVEYSHEQKDWVAALEYVGVLSRLSFASDDVIRELTVASWIGRIQAAEEDGLSNVWHAVPRAYKYDEALVLAYVEALSAHDRVDAAIRMLERALKRQWRGAWVRVFGSLEGNAEKQLKMAEEWQSEHQGDPDLNLVLGRFYRRLGRIKDAENYIERSVRLGGGIAAELELAELHLESGMPQRAKDALENLKRSLAEV